MTLHRPQLVAEAAADEALPPELLRIIEALAEAQARADYAGRNPTQAEPA